MRNVLIINGHQPYPFAEGRLNAAMVERIKVHLETKGYTVRITESAKGYDVDAEVDNHVWADAVIVQHPVNWMGVPWSLKKYMDEVYSAGMDGRLCNGDGRSSQSPKDGYGTGGTLTGTKFMLSVTFNAPREAFDDPDQVFFAGQSVDDLLRPIHLNAKFFDMTSLPTFSAHDVMKAPEIAADFDRLEAHLAAHFPPAGEASHVAA